MFLNSLFLAISSSIDSLGIGITYGIKNMRIKYMSKVVLFTISFIFSIFSLWLGSALKNIFSTSISSYIGSLILILMGTFMFIQSLKKEKTQKNIKKINIKNLEEEKIYSFFIKCLGITIKIIKNPIYSDIDNSNTIDTKEALFLGIALSLDSFCIGISCSMLQINSLIFPLAISTFQLFFMSLGNLIGRKLCTITKIPSNIWSIISSILLILIGIIKLF